MRPANSYQDPSMTPPDQPDLGDEECSVDGCPWMEIIDTELCEEHLRERGDEDRADRMRDQAKYDREEYGQYETDNSIG